MIRLVIRLVIELTMVAQVEITMLVVQIAMLVVELWGMDWVLPGYVRLEGQEYLRLAGQERLRMGENTPLEYHLRLEYQCHRRLEYPPLVPQIE